MCLCGWAFCEKHSGGLEEDGDKQVCCDVLTALLKMLLHGPCGGSEKDTWAAGRTVHVWQWGDRALC